ncbi:MAG: SUMF1/EgtB/PvdO family nonheme iron enzyme [Thermoguttaceae bacterium]|nr:SUMF1/EgtB/PvdO family nonheme iron enzyme [Thermoguttaceae bacterium]
MEIEISGVKTAFRWAPSGSFVRHWNRKTEGDWGEPTAWSGDKKDFVITLTRGFWLAETETTQELWQAVAGKNLSDGEQTKTTPVNNISWEETQEFVSKLNDGGYAPDGFEFQLPTEAQWEYACMAGAADERYGELDAIAWYLDNSDGHAHEVGQKGANAWGLYDMLGNVWEWCYDLNKDYPMGNLTDYAGPRMGLDHVCRGGSWSLDAAGVSSSRRSHSRVGYRGLGFRLALVRKER